MNSDPSLPTGESRFYTVFSISDLRRLLANATAQVKAQDALFVIGGKPCKTAHRCVVLEGTLSPRADLASNDGALQASAHDMTVRSVLFSKGVRALSVPSPTPSPSL